MPAARDSHTLENPALSASAQAGRAGAGEHFRPTHGIPAPVGQSSIRKSIRLSITLAGAAAGVLLFGSYGVLMVVREKTDLRQAVTREMGILGESLAAGVRSAVRDGQLGDVRDALVRLEAEDASVDVTVYDAKGRVLARSEGGTDDPLQSEVLAAVLGDGATAFRYQGDEAPFRAVVGLPLLDDAGRVDGALTVLRPLDDVRHDLRKTVEGIFGAVVAFVLAIAAIGWMTGTWFVLRPLEDIRASVAKVRAGSFEGHIRLRRDDEIGALATDFNRMIDELADARRRGDEEARARMSLERGLAEVSRLASTGQLAASLAHEIGSPLQVMAGRARSLAERPGDEASVRRVARILVEQTERVARIVEQLLHVGRRSPQPFTTFEVSTAIRPVVELLALDAERRRVAVVFHAPAGRLEIAGNVDHVQQLVLNLVNNAVTACRAGGRVDVTLQGRGDGIALSVRDDGAGIAPDALPSVFEPFFTTRAGEGGTGLGLAIVRAIVREHGGHVDIQSQPGQGTTVTVELPSRREAADAGQVTW